MLTNRLPRQLFTRLMGRFSRIRNPLVKSASIALWQLFVDDLRLHEAKKARFDSLHDCFTRELKAGARPFDTDPDVLASPCDAVVGAGGTVRNGTVLQVKGYPYLVVELVDDAALARRLEGSSYVTLRLKSSMYHRFHAPCDGRLESVRRIAGDTWNVNPATLKAIEGVFCRNARAVLKLRGAAHEGLVTLVPVAAILVSSLRIHGLGRPLDATYAGPVELRPKRAVRRGDQLGYFEHGSTIIMFVPPGWHLDTRRADGSIVRTGMPLFRRAPVRNTADNCA